MPTGRNTLIQPKTKHLPMHPASPSITRPGGQVHSPPSLVTRHVEPAGQKLREALQLSSTGIQGEKNMLK